MRRLSTFYVFSLMQRIHWGASPMQPGCKLLDCQPSGKQKVECREGQTVGVRAGNKRE